MLQADKEATSSPYLHSYRPDFRTGLYILNDRYRYRTDSDKRKLGFEDNKIMCQYTFAEEECTALMERTGKKKEDSDK